jgi:hypothetical protein
MDTFQSKIYFHHKIKCHIEQERVMVRKGLITNRNDVNIHIGLHLKAFIYFEMTRRSIMRKIDQLYSFRISFSTFTLVRNSNTGRRSHKIDFHGLLSLHHFLIFVIHF